MQGVEGEPSWKVVMLDCLQTLLLPSAAIAAVMCATTAARCQCDEFLLRAEAGLPAAEVLASATLTCAQLFNMEVR